MTTLPGERVFLRRATDDDIEPLVAIRAAPEVFRWWRGGDDLRASVIEDLEWPGATCYVIEIDDTVVGMIQWLSEEEPDYRHASIDIFVDANFHRRGIGSDALGTLVRHLFGDLGYHRIEIDPSAENVAAIGCYEKLGFAPIGIRREAERGVDGTWHDVLLMDLLAREVDNP